MKRWYCLAAEGKREHLAQGLLESVGYKTFLPKMEVLHSNGRLITTPMFPKYMFVDAEIERLLTHFDIWRSKNVYTHIQAILGRSHNTIPEPVDTTLIYDLKHGLDPLTDTLPYVKPLEEICNEYNPGDIVRFKDGSMSSTLLIVSQLNGPQRVSLLWHVLGRECNLRNVDTALLLKEAKTGSFQSLT